MVPGLDGPPPPPPTLPPPQAERPASAQNIIITPSKTSHPRRRLGRKKKKARARAVPAVVGKKIFSGAFRALLAAVVVTVSVEVTGVEDVISTVAGDRLQVAGSLAAVGLMLQVSATLPVNPPEGVTLMVEVFPVLEPRTTLTGVAEMVNPGMGLTTTAKTDVAGR